MSELAASSQEFRDSVALGEDVRLESPRLFGAGLAYEGEMIQLSVFPKDVEEMDGSGEGLERASGRRRRSRG